MSKMYYNVVYCTVADVQNSGIEIDYCHKVSSSKCYFKNNIKEFLPLALIFFLIYLQMLFIWWPNLEFYILHKQQYDKNVKAL